VFVDILAFGLLMYAAGGVQSGLGVLLAVAVAAGALMMEGRLSLLFAALATLVVITQQVVAHLQGGAPAAGYTQAGLLGVLFFTVALLAHLLYRRLHAVEALAARRQVDIDDLSKLNDYIIQNMGTGILVVDGERRLRMMNQAARDLLGTPSQHPAPSCVGSHRRWPTGSTPMYSPGPPRGACSRWGSGSSSPPGISSGPIAPTAC
jgi:two-component system, NtrC family, sensor histidine kinase PilS